MCDVELEAARAMGNTAFPVSKSLLKFTLIDSDTSDVVASFLMGNDAVNRAQAAVAELGIERWGIEAGGRLHG